MWAQKQRRLAHARAGPECSLDGNAEGILGNMLALDRTRLYGIYYGILRYTTDYSLYSTRELIGLRAEVSKTG